LATLREIRNRIAGVKKTQKITRAMKMVSAAKFARAQAAISSARPYAQKLRAVLGAVASGVDPDAHPLLVPRDRVRKLDVVVFTSDRGLCGAYNANIIKHAEKLVALRRPELESVSVLGFGKKGCETIKSRKIAPIVHRWIGVTRVGMPAAAEIADVLMKRYENGDCDEVVLVFSEFVSALTQRPTDLRLLPLQAGSPGEAPATVYDVEPDPVSLLRELVPRSVEFAVFRALLENQAGEHGARMTAMENATNNTQELIRSLTLDGNKARQAAITAELVEIVSGAEAL
jgi:F-type H+-transporting ATPase subunit gamma